tara:strand:- start:218 stop:1243 length:1026 start_codon:yes stop_codon:yes gene_type:complete
LKKIAVINTGGTINSVLGDGSIVVDASLKQLSQEIQLLKMQLDCEIELYVPFSKSSENLHPSDWYDLLVALTQANDSDCEGIVVTHGTDTMEYSAAAVICCGQLWRKKICFTGAYYPPELAKSDAYLNLLGALKWTCESSVQHGVAVSFSTGEQRPAEILNAFGLKSMLYDECFFSSSGKNFAYYGKQKDTHVLDHHQEVIPQLDLTSIPTKENISFAASRVVFVRLYPGIDLKYLSSVAADRDILVLQSYHSATGPADEDSDLLKFVASQSKEVSIFMAGYSEELLELPYASSLELIRAGLYLCKNIPAYYLYVYLLMGLAVGLDKQALAENLSEFQVSS